MSEKKKVKKRKKLFVFLIVSCALIVAGIGTVFGIDYAVVSSTEDRIYDGNDGEDTYDIPDIGEYDCILVLGCGVRDGEPSHMLEDRLKVGVSLYEAGAAPKLLMSGDHGREEYDEVNVMRSFAMDAGVPSEDIFMDHAGFSTYESIVRAKEVFGAERILIVSQEYHLNRALYIADAFGIEAYGVSADLREYRGRIKNELREILSRNKDLVFCLIKPEPTYLGDPIDLGGDGNVTVD